MHFILAAICYSAGANCVRCDPDNDTKCAECEEGFYPHPDDGRCAGNYMFNTLASRQNDCHFADDTFKRIFMNENIIMRIETSLKCVPKGPINNIPALVQIMAWRRRGNKPLSQLIIVSVLTHMWVTRPQWVNSQNTFYVSH